MKVIASLFQALELNYCLAMRILNDNRENEFMNDLIKVKNKGIVEGLDI